MRSDESLASSQVDPMQALFRVAAGEPTDADIEWMARAFRALVSNMGEVSLERCLRLPSSYSAWRKAERDRWLCKVATCLVADSSWGAAQQIEMKWTKFIERGNWKRWRDLELPPYEASLIDEALFFATKLNKGYGLDAKQISRIVRQNFSQKCPKP